MLVAMAINAVGATVWVPGVVAGAMASTGGLSADRSRPPTGYRRAYFVVITCAVCLSDCVVHSGCMLAVVCGL